MSENKENEEKKEVTQRRNKRWFPLESNPDVMTEYIGKMGFPTDTYRFFDVLSTEDWALGMVPQPALAVILLYPIKEHSEQIREEQTKKYDEEGQPQRPDELIHFKQHIGNACGTFGILHTMANIQNEVNFVEDSFLTRFVNIANELNTTQSKLESSESIARWIEDDDELENVHGEAANEGQSNQVESVDTRVNTHFNAFTLNGGYIWELDGRKKYPIPHGESSRATFLSDVANVIRTEFIEKDPGENNFAIVALGPNIPL